MGAGGGGGENERLSTVQEMSHSTHSDDETSDDHPLHCVTDDHEDQSLDQPSSASSAMMKQAGSPHPNKSCYTKLSFTPEQEEILKQALQETKAKKKSKLSADNSSHRTGRCQTENGEPTSEYLCHGEAVVICEVALTPEAKVHSASDDMDLHDTREVTSTV